MRFKLILQVNANSFGNQLPINYQYELSAAIYRILSCSNAEYSYWLHENGFVADHKRFKLFTFSNLIIPRLAVQKETERLVIKSDIVEWYISFLPEKSTQRFIEGVFMEQTFQIGDKISVVEFKVKEIQALPPLHYQEVLSFETLSPVTISHRISEKVTNYLSPESPFYKKAILTGLLARYKAFYGKDYVGSLDFDFQVLNQPRSALVKIKSGTPQQIFVRGYRYKFTVRLSSELMKVMYEAGLGEKGSVGFGFIKRINL